MLKTMWPAMFWVAMAAALLAFPSSAHAVPGRLSCVVSFTIDDERASAWLREPGLAFMEAWVLFPPELGDNVLFGLDHEFLESKDDPIHVSGGDWMALVGLNRKGDVWVATGTPETMEGKPSKDRKWEILKLGTALQPNVWYRLECVADFGNRQFVRFTVEGPGVDKTLDLSPYTLDYPNELPFSGRALTHFLWSMYGESLGPATDHTTVYFDDARFGLMTRETDASGKPVLKETPLFSDDFERTPGGLPGQPISVEEYVKTQTIALKPYKQHEWYLEREDARARLVEVPFARSGKIALEADATLRDVGYDQWLEQRRNAPATGAAADAQKE